MGDFNGDGHLDFIAADGSSLSNFANSVALRLGNGLGEFSAAPNVSVGSTPAFVAVGDLNGDGNLDFVTVNTGSNDLSIRLGNGAGGFSSAATVGGVGAGLGSVALGDFNGDGHLDLAVASFSVGGVAIRLGDGAGNFSSADNVVTGFQPTSVALGDFNGDGYLDLAVANLGAETVSIRLGNGAGGFSGTTNVAVGRQPNSVVIGDFNGDGYLDFVAAHRNQADTSLRMYLGDGLGGFSGNIRLALADEPTAIALGDFDGDGHIDFATSLRFSNQVVIATTAGRAATLTIADPPVVNLSVSATTGSEAGTTEITVTATASSAVTGNQTVAVGVSGVEITTEDYRLSDNGIITIADGATTGSITFTVVDDTISEGPETALLTLINPSTGLMLGNSISQAITIADNDSPPTTGNITLTLNEDTVFTFASRLFPFADADAGDTLQGIRITQRPAAGQLFLDANNDNQVNAGELITVNQDIAVANLNQLKFKPAPDANGLAYASFQFRVTDGQFFSTTPGTATFNVTPVNDAPTGTVRISGTATQGETLTASNTLADRDGLGPISYQWRADGTVIRGATASTFALTQAQVGKAMTVTASYTDGFGRRESVTSAPTRAVVNINDAPTGTVRTSGTATQGQTLTASNTLADRDGLGPISYQWRADGTAIRGATNSTFTLTQAQVGRVITVAASYTDGFGRRESVTSAPTRAVVNINDAPTGTVRISGTATQGQTLTASNTLADRDGLGPISYQWRADGTAIRGATNSTFTLTQAQVGRVITVAASYTDGFGRRESVTSAPTRAVVNINDAPTGTVRISGTATQGQTLTASNTLADRDGLGPISYQWWADGTAIRGATASTFALTQAQVGRVITVAASYTDGFGRRESVTSAPTRAVSPLTTSRSSLPLRSNTDRLAPTLATPGGLLDLTGQRSPSLTLTFQMSQSSSFNNTVGFYLVEDTQGRVRDPLTGTLIQPGEAGYLQAALANRVVDDLVGRNDRTTTVTTTLATNQLLSTFLVVGGPVAALLDTNPGNDPTVFFNHVAANGDRQDHVRLLGQNTLGYEDTWGGGDRDFNDVIVRTTVA